MEKLNCVVIDDEPLAVKLIENYIQRTPFLNLQASYTDSVSAIAELKAQPPHLVFLDIQMPDLDGMELSRMIPEDTRIIFTTAFKQYAFDSYEVNALDFLLKPIRYGKFLEAAMKAKEWFDLREQAAGKEKSDAHKHIFLKSEGELHQVDINDILLVMGMKDYVVFKLQRTDGKITKLITHSTMSAIEEMLPSERFLRVSRSYIVAKDKIRSIDRNDCITIGDEVIHVTEAYKPAFDNFLNGK
ncbi:MAG: LytR/AlgR family response regulator transcription factor [Prevotella sp.]|jgi:DNA-binding LytR/AlgR family response regulator